MEMGQLRRASTDAKAPAAAAGEARLTRSYRDWDVPAWMKSMDKRYALAAEQFLKEDRNGENLLNDAYPSLSKVFATLGPGAQESLLRDINKVRAAHAHTMPLVPPGTVAAPVPPAAPAAVASAHQVRDVRGKIAIVAGGSVMTTHRDGWCLQSLAPRFEDVLHQRLEEGFVGRTAEFAAAQKWLEDSGADVPPVFVISGNPGVGKSTFICQLIRARALLLQQQEQQHKPKANPTAAAAQAGAPVGAEIKLASHVAAVHVAQYDDKGETRDPMTFVRSLAAQMCKTVPGFKEALGAEHADGGSGWACEAAATDEWEILRSGTASAALQMGVFAALKKCGCTKRWLVLVDSLDESVYQRDCKTPNSSIAALLANMHDIPPCLRFLVTTRPDEQVLSALAVKPRQVLKRSLTADGSRADVATYLRARLEIPALKAVVKDVPNVEKTLNNLADGNFLVARQITFALAQGHFAARELLDRDQPIRELAELYDEFAKRAFRDALPPAVERLLGVVVASGSVSQYHAVRIAELEINADDARPAPSPDPVPPPAAGGRTPMHAATITRSSVAPQSHPLAAANGALPVAAPAADAPVTPRKAWDLILPFLTDRKVHDDDDLAAVVPAQTPKSNTWQLPEPDLKSMVHLPQPNESAGLVYRVYHRSFAEWLVLETPKYRVNLPAAYRGLAVYQLMSVCTDPVEPRAALHVLQQLTNNAAVVPKWLQRIPCDQIGHNCEGWNVEQFMYWATKSDVSPWVWRAALHFFTLCCEPEPIRDVEMSPVPAEWRPLCADLMQLTHMYDPYVQLFEAAVASRDKSQTAAVDAKSLLERLPARRRAEAVGNLLGGAWQWVHEKLRYPLTFLSEHCEWVYTPTMLDAVLQESQRQPTRGHEPAAAAAPALAADAATSAVPAAAERVIVTVAKALAMRGLEKLERKDSALLEALRNHAKSHTLAGRQMTSTSHALVERALQVLDTIEPQTARSIRAARGRLRNDIPKAPSL